MSTKVFSCIQKVINNVGVCLRPQGKGSGISGGCLSWVVQALLRHSQVVLCGAAAALARFFGFQHLVE